MSQITQVLAEMAQEVSRMVLEGAVRAGESRDKAEEVLRPVVEAYAQKIQMFIESSNTSPRAPDPAFDAVVTVPTISTVVTNPPFDTSFTPSSGKRSKKEN